MEVVITDKKNYLNMTQEDKKLLLQDLSARLPYTVKLQIEYEEMSGSGTYDEDLLSVEKDNSLCLVNGRWIEYVRPYLCSMSSMTNETKRECFEKAILYSVDINGRLHFDGFGILNAEETIEAFDWLNSHHIDYRGLIEKGLALEAPEGMYS